MGLQDFLDSGRLKRHQATADEIHKLFTVFQALRRLLQKARRHVLDYFDDCRSKRNLAEYLGLAFPGQVGYSRAMSKVPRDWLPIRRPDSHKGDFGHVLLVAHRVPEALLLGLPGTRAGAVENFGRLVREAPGKRAERFPVSPAQSQDYVAAVALLS